MKKTFQFNWDWYNGLAFGVMWDWRAFGFAIVFMLGPFMLEFSYAE